MRDCLFLVADKNMEGCLAGLFSRNGLHASISTAPFAFDPLHDLKVYAGGSDPGLYCRAHEVLKVYQSSHRRAVVVLDAEWDGSPGPARIIEHIGSKLRQNGWAEDRFAVIVIEPELESWIWQDSPHVATALRFNGPQSLRETLRANGQWPDDQAKPHRPKEAAEAVLRITRRPRSSSIYREIGSRVSLQNCTDGAFQAFTGALRSWFPLGAA